MIVYRELEHHLHRSHQKIPPIFLNYGEEIESVYVSYTDCPYDSGEPDEYDDYEFASKIPECYIFLESINEYFIKIRTWGKKYNIYTDQNSYFPSVPFYFYEIWSDMFECSEFCHKLS